MIKADIGKSWPDSGGVVGTAEVAGDGRRNFCENFGYAFPMRVISSPMG